MTEIAIDNAQNAVTPKIGKLELCSCVLHVVLCSFILL